MAYLKHSVGEVRLFLVGYSNAPLQGDGNGLTNKSLPLHALLRLGELEVPEGDEHILGVQFSSYLAAPIIKSVEYFASLVDEDFRLLVHELPKDVKRVVAEVYRGNSVTKDGENLIHRKFRNIAVLTPLSVLKDVSFRVRDGFGLLVPKNVLDEMQSENEKKRARAKKNRGTATFTLPRVAFRNGELRADLAMGVDDLQFLCSSMKKWDVRFRRERQACWDAGARRVYGALV